MLKHVDKALKEIGKDILREAKKELAAGGHNTTGRLNKSLKVVIRNDEVWLEGLEYGKVLNEGLSGTEVKRATPYTVGVNVHVRYKSIQDWVKKKGIASGVKGISKAAYNIYKSIRREGYAPKMWATRAQHDVEVDAVKTVQRALRADIAETLKRL